MTATIDRDRDSEVDDHGFATSLIGGDDEGRPEGDDDAAGESIDAQASLAIRPLLVAACSSAGAALTVGGIFGSWAARAFCLLMALAGVGWSALAARSSRRTAYHAALPAVALGLAVLSLTAGAPGGPANLPDLVREAIDSGRSLRPPIPFDAGWRPILIVVLLFLGFAAGTAGTLFERPRAALVVPLPLLGLTAISQPSDGQAVAGLLAVLPVVAALGVLYGADGGGVAQLSRDFELRRVVKAAAYVGVAVAVVLALNTTSLLFPEPVYDPAQEAQKPKPVPLGAAQDRVLFEVDVPAGAPITGPWKMGSLDEYDGEAWRLPPFDPKTWKRAASDGVIDSSRPSDVTVRFTVRDLGTNATLPGVTGPTRIKVTGVDVAYDPRAGTFRMRSGRVPTGLTYEQSLPTYPGPEALRSATASTPSVARYTKMPSAPPAVRDLLSTAPSGPWDRLDHVLKALAEVEIAAGTGTPKDIPPSRVQEILAGNHEGSPYELVAARAMLARWAGIPARIGFGFDGMQEEGGVNTVRPRNAAQWLEVYFEGYGWVPIVTAPPKAKASLDNDDNTKFNPTIEAGSDVAVQVYIPVKVKTLVLLYQRVRALLVRLLPLVVLGLAAYLALPWMQKTWRRAKRRRWAAAHGAAAAIAVEYCEFRDLATDLGVGDPFATPIEYLDHVVEDDEHEEFAWLVTKALYGELWRECSAADVAAARELADSLRSRLMRAQPLQTRLLAVLSKLSLENPYSTEVPGVRALRVRLPRPRRLRMIGRTAA